jgi:thiol-disulfide isomerase/thioredoxin
MKLKRKTFLNIGFLLFIVLLFYPPTKVFFIRLISFSPSIEKVEDRKEIIDYNWYLKGLNTENVNFNDVKGKVLFVNFWATWCPPCVSEMPEIQKIYNDYKDKVDFLFVTSDDWETAEKFYKKRKYDLPTYNQLTKRPDILFSKSIPATFVIDKKGKIAIDKRGAANWNSNSVRKLLDRLVSE